MRHILFLFCSFLFLAAAQAQQFTLVKKHRSKCTIIIPEKANVVEIQAALVFQDYIQRISGRQHSDRTRL